jgi:hypothetical protein
LISEEVPISPALFELDWANHWKNQEVKQETDYWSLFHFRSDWFGSKTSRPRFSWLILEIAAFRGLPKGGFQRRFMGFLYDVFKFKDEKGLQILFANSSDSITQIHDQLRAHFREGIPYKYKKLLGL